MPLGVLSAVPLALYGKLPARGDFLTLGLPPERLKPWDAWLTAVTAGSRPVLGPRWQSAWDGARPWRFWIGARAPLGPAAGVLLPSRDRVGRRFPLLLLWSGAETADGPAAPVAGHAASVAWYAALAELALRLAAPELEGEPAALLHEFPAPPPAPDGADPSSARGAFMAHGDSGLGPLLADVAAHDRALAAAGRSYWWTEAAPEGAAALLALEGLPDAAGIAALLDAFAPAPAEEPAPATETQPQEAEATPDPDGAARQETARTADEEVEEDEDDAGDRDDTDAPEHPAFDEADESPFGTAGPAAGGRH